MSTGYVTLFDSSGNGLGIASAATTIDFGTRALTTSGALSGLSSVSATSLTGTLQTASQPNVTTLAAVTSLNNITVGSGTLAGLSSVSATSLTGTLSTAAQTNITSLGTLSALAIAGAPNGTNLLDVQSYPASAGTVSQTSAIRVYQGSYNHPGGGTISSMYGVYISAGLGGETGDIFLGANLYVQTPLFGDRRISAVFEGNVVITPSVSSAPTLATDLQIHSATQNSSRLTFSGQEFYQAANTSTEGPAFVLGVNRANNRQVWLVDSANASIASTTNYMLRFNVSSTNATIDAMSTDGATAKTLTLGHSSGGLALFGSVRGSIDNTHFGFDTSDPPRFGMTKKSGFITKLTHGSATSFAIARSSTNDIAATGTFTDELVIDTSGQVTLGVGLFLPTSGGTATLLNYYEELSQTFTFAGVWAANQSVTGKLVRVGKTVTLVLPSVYAATNASANILQTAGTAFPSRFRPAVTVSFIVRMADNSAFVPALMYARSDGLIQAYSNAGGLSFAATGSAGWDLVSITWNVL